MCHFLSILVELDKGKTIGDQSIKGLKPISKGTTYFSLNNLGSIFCLLKNNKCLCTILLRKEKKIKGERRERILAEGREASNFVGVLSKLTGNEAMFVFSKCLHKDTSLDCS